MKALLFRVGPQRYGLALRQVVRVLPALALTSLPLAPPCVAGLMDLHGQPVPVLDLERLAGLAPPPLMRDSRIIVIELADAGGAARQLGLLAAQVLGVSNIDPASVADSGVRYAPFLGRVASDAHGLLQLVEPAGLLAPEVRAMLFQPTQAAP